MSTIMISPEEQHQVIQKLSHSDDGITSLHRFNEQYGVPLGHLGERHIPLKDFARKMKATHFMGHDYGKEVESTIKEITGQDIDLSHL
jgi:hypothetical protein